MITLVEREEQKQRLRELCGRSAFGCRIASVVRAYGFDKGFACFWLEEESGVVFCQADDVMILAGTVIDPGRTRSFLQSVGPVRLLCAVRNAEVLDLQADRTGDVLKKQLAPSTSPPVELPVPDIRGLFHILEETGLAEEDFETFYLDLSHRLRHAASLALTEERAGESVGCAVISSLAENAAILSAVAVLPNYQRQGIGAALVRRAENCLSGKTLYIFREKNAQQEFVQSLEYQKCDTWVLAHL